MLHYHAAITILLATTTCGLHQNGRCFWNFGGIGAVKGCVKPGSGVTEGFNRTVCNTSGILRGHGFPPKRRNLTHGHGGISRCNARLDRGRGTGCACNLLRGRFTHACSRTTHVNNVANRGLLGLLRYHLSGIICHLNVTPAHTTTHRLISRYRVYIGNGIIGVPSCSLHTNSIISIHRGSGDLRIVSTSLTNNSGDHCT